MAINCKPSSQHNKDLYRIIIRQIKAILNLEMRLTLLGPDGVAFFNIQLKH